MTRTELIAAIKAYALAHYEEDGWDVLVECWNDGHISDELGRVSTLRGAIWKLKKVLATYNDYRSEIEATAF